MSSPAAALDPTARARRAIRVRGTVQGVGFRPSVYRLAKSANLSGFVRNDSEGVWIEVEGDAGAVARFPDLLRSEAPPLSRIDSIEVADLPTAGDREFRVVASAAQETVTAAVPPDAATCDACRAELFDPANRRYRYPFINCTDCGPRYTIVRDVPYDRGRTTMERFVLCASCRSEYEDPSDRRFHAEPNACPDCGPQLEIALGGGVRRGEEALAHAVSEIAAGRIVAVKGLGGFLLAVDAANESAVALLRERKRRPRKPFAVMARDLEHVEAVAILDEESRGALLSGVRPIVLLPARPGSAVAPGVAPGLSEIGVMLPYTPLHHLLLADGPPLQVMTSGNLSEEPIAKDNADAVGKLAGIADVFLVHDRDIHTRADDSVVRMIAGAPVPVRRSRGFVAKGIRLGFAAPPVLAVGAELKNTVCLTRGDQGFLSPHVGDLENVETFAFFEEVIGKLSHLLAVEPIAVAHDLHPDYFSTRWALASGLPREPVQHHHAHVASCLAEHGLTGPVVGVAFDGTGCGPAGDLWGGEFLLADLAGFRRLGHLRPIALAGGEAAIRQPWRLGAAALLDAGEPLDLLERVGAPLRSVQRLLEKGVGCPLATGAGRWFDAVSALCGIKHEVTYEGEAAIELEAVAASGEFPPYPFEMEEAGREPFPIDLRPAVREIAADRRRGIAVSTVAARFHETLAAVIRESCRRAREATGVGTVALSGGCFQNKLLTERATTLLERDGFEVLIHRSVPPNDGGLALGQAAVAAFRLREKGA